MEHSITRLACRLIPILPLLSAATAMAQSQVTLYGVVDQSIRYTNHADADNDGQVQLTNGAVTNSRWGMLGSEDLGDGLKAIFRLESGFSPNTGQGDSALFDRYSYVGLSGKSGTVKFGLQPTEGFNLFAELDPLTIGNYPGNMWLYYLTMGRAPNAVSYENTLGNLVLGASYSFGGQPGSVSRDSYWGTRVTYKIGDLKVGAVYQSTRDDNNRQQQMWGAIGRYTVGPANLFLGYLGGIDETGILDEALNAPGRTVTYGSSVANPRRDAILITGATYQVVPAVTVTGALYAGRTRAVNGLPDNTGRRYTGVLLAEYALSAGTQLYGTVDYNKVSGGTVTELPGTSNQTGVAVGIRHIF
jgi:predicted porin